MWYGVKWGLGSGGGFSLESFRIWKLGGYLEIKMVVRGILGVEKSVGDRISRL